MFLFLNGEKIRIALRIKIQWNRFDLISKDREKKGEGWAIFERHSARTGIGENFNSG